MSAGCFYCDARAEPVGGLPFAVCSTCARRVADLASDPTSSFWRDAAPAQPQSQQPDDRVDEDQVFADFKAGVAQQICAEDADSHVSLATAYVEMGLLGDARREAAAALSAKRPTPARTAALRMLLSEPLLSKVALARLRERIRQPIH